MPIWQLCANLLIPNCLRSNLSYSPQAALELYVNSTKTVDYIYEEVGDSLKIYYTIAFNSTQEKYDKKYDKTISIDEKKQYDSLLLSLISKPEYADKDKNILYKYQEYDKYGNWTKRTYNQDYYERTEQVVSIREIQYYE